MAALAEVGQRLSALSDEATLSGMGTSGATCARCGKLTDGYGSIFTESTGELVYCHPDDPAKPDCYSLAMAETWGEELPAEDMGTAS